MVQFKNKWEKEKGVKFSKRGLVDFIEKFINDESATNQKAWEQKL